MSYETTTPAPAPAPSTPVTETVKEVASRSAGEAKQLTGEALDGARQLVRSGRDEVRGQLQQQTTRAADAARTASSQLLALASGDTQNAERAQSFARDVGNRLQELADRLDREGLDGIARQTSDFARRRPALFLGGIALAGFVAGRYAKVIMERNDDASQSFTGGSGSANQAGNGWRRPEPLTGRPAVIDPVLPVDPVTGAPMITEPTGYQPSTASNTSLGTNPSRAGFDRASTPGSRPVSTGSHQVSDADLAVEPKEPERSTTEIIGSVASRFGELVSKELKLAKVEMTEEAKRGAKASSMLVVGALIGYLALIMVSVAVALWLDEVMHPAIAFAIVAAVWAVVAGIAIVAGRNRLRQLDPVPHQTIETVKEDVEWARTQRS